MKYGDTPAIYGTFLYGSTDTEPAMDLLRFDLAFDWDETGDYYTNEARYMLSWETDRGRDQMVSVNGNGFEPYDTGKANFVLDNSSRRYDPYFTSSPLYGQIEPGKKMRFRVWDNADNMYSVFTGTISNIVPNQDDKTTVITCADGWEYLRNSHVYSTAIRWKKSGEFINYILDRINWPWGRDIDVGGTYLATWMPDYKKSAAAQIFEIGNSDMKVFTLRGDGTATYGASNIMAIPTTDTTSLEITQDIIDRSIPYSDPWNIIYDRVTANTQICGNLATTDVYVAGDSMYFSAGETKTIWAQYLIINQGTWTSIGAIGSPPISGTDFIGNSLADGTGTNTTSDYTVTFADYGSKAKLVITNSGAASYLTTLKIQGTPVVVYKYSLSYPVNPVSNGREFTFDSLWSFTGYNTNNIEQYLQLIKSFLTLRGISYPTVFLENRPVQQFTDVMGLAKDNDGKEIHLTLNYYGGDMGYFRVGRIIHQSGETPQFVRTTIKLEPTVAPLD